MPVFESLLNHPGQMSANWIPLELLLSSGVVVRIVFALRVNQSSVCR